MQVTEKVKKKGITIRPSGEIREWLESVREKTGLTVSSIIIMLILKEMEKEDEQ